MAKWKNTERQAGRFQIVSRQCEHDRLPARLVRGRDLRAVAPEAGQTPLRNVDGGFERAERGVHRLTPGGRAGLAGQRRDKAALRGWPNACELRAPVSAEPA